MNKWKRIRPYVAFCAIALAVGGASSFATRAGMADFDLLTKPPAAPPDWLFPIAWTILYLLMGIAMGLVWRSSIGRARKEATALWSIQLAVNGLWPVLFFLLGAHGPAFFWLVGLIKIRSRIISMSPFQRVVLFMIADFSRRNAAAAWLSAPYLLWLLFAAYLNLGIWLLNR